MKLSYTVVINHTIEKQKSIYICENSKIGSKIGSAHIRLVFLLNGNIMGFISVCNSKDCLNKCSSTHPHEFACICR